VRPDRRALPVLGVPWVQKVPPAQPDQPGHKALRVSGARSAQPVLPVLKAPPVLPVLKVPPVLPVLKALQAPLVPPVPPAQRVWKVRVAQPVPAWPASKWSR